MIERIRLQVADDITQLVGDTPILKLKRLVPLGSAEVYAKLEYLNPGGSLKDRAAIGIIGRAEQDGKLQPERWLWATSLHWNAGLRAASAIRRSDPR